MPRKLQRATLFDFDESKEPAAKRKPVPVVRTAITQRNDVEAAKARYLSSFTHVQCGGNPVAWIGGRLACTRCRETFEVGGNEALGDQLHRLRKNWSKHG